MESCGMRLSAARLVTYHSLWEIQGFERWSCWAVMGFHALMDKNKKYLRAEMLFAEFRLLKSAGVTTIELFVIKSVLKRSWEWIDCTQSSEWPMKQCSDVQSCRDDHNLARISLLFFSSFFLEFRVWKHMEWFLTDERDLVFVWIRLTARNRAKKLDNAYL